MKTCFVIISLLILVPVAAAQSSNRKHVVSMTIAHSVGEFSTTHGPAIGIDYTHIPGQPGVFKIKQLGFTYSGGGICFFGKKVNRSGFYYRYKPSLFIYGQGGLVYSLKNTGISLTAGPELNFYQGHTAFEITGKLEVKYTIAGKYAVGPMLVFMKEPGANALWAGGIKAGIIL